MPQIDQNDRRYQEWVEALPLPLAGQHPIDALVAHYLDRFGEIYVWLFDRAADPKTIVRNAVVSAMSSFAFTYESEPQRRIDVRILELRIDSHLSYEELIFSLIDAERSRRVLRAAELRAAHRDAAGSANAAAASELEQRLRAAESDFQNWISLDRVDFQLDAAGKFLEGRTDRGKAALRG